MNFIKAIFFVLFTTLFLPHAYAMQGQYCDARVVRKQLVDQWYSEDPSVRIGVLNGCITLVRNGYELDFGNRMMQAAICDPVPTLRIAGLILCMCLIQKQGPHLFENINSVILRGLNDPCPNVAATALCCFNAINQK